MKDEPCCDWVGADGAGHYVKMVHNGIEYGDMQVRRKREREKDRKRNRHTQRDNDRQRN